MVFNICGNRYRLVVHMQHDMGRVFIRHVVTHREYDLLMKRKRLWLLPAQCPSTEAAKRCRDERTFHGDDVRGQHDNIDETKCTPQSVVAFMLDQRGLTRARLAPLTGGESRVSEFFAGKRRTSWGSLPTC